MASRLCTIFSCLLALLSPVLSRKGHLAPLGESGTVTPIPYVQDGFPSPKVFLNEYVLKNKPLLMRGAALDMPALHLWTDAYMTAKTAPLKEEVGYEKGKKETRTGGGKMTFLKFLQTYNESDIYFVNAVPKSLTSDVIIPWSLQCKEYQRSFEDNVMWFSSGGTKSVIHHDGYENVNCLLRGRKRFLFVNTTKYRDIRESIIDIEEGSYGSVDVERVDLEKYPFYEGMEFFSVDMNPGDCVYSPLLWIHQVESWGSNIAVNVWWFSEINKMVDVSNCNPSYNKSMTFNTVAFHRTTEVSDGRYPEKTIFAMRHAIARMVFRATGMKEVSGSKFITVLSGNKKARADHIHTLAALFHAMDANRNKKLDLDDMEMELSDRKANRLLQQGSEWMSTARIHDYPLPVDFSDDSYLTIAPFSWSEIESDDDTNFKNSEPRQSELPETVAASEKVPRFDGEIKTNIGDRDEL